MGSIAVCALVATPLATPAAGSPKQPPAPSETAGKTDSTSANEAKRVDRVKLPKPHTFDCSSITGVPSQCGTVKLPRDYERPKGAKTEVAYLRIKAKDQKNKIGTLFLNPGGPGGSGVGIATAAPDFLSPELLKRFDVVGVDPRGTNFSDNVRCFNNLGKQAAALGGLDVAFPTTRKEMSAYERSSVAFGKGCSSTGKPLSAHMSTANVARDMDVLRRMFGDKQLTYLGFSYGSYLGNVYANMYPDRVRAVTIDGVLDPIGWAGTPATQRTPVTQRLRSGEGANKAIQEILRLCKKKGAKYCQFAADGDPKAKYDKLVAKLKKAPLVIVAPEDPESSFEVDYPTLVAFLLGDLYAPIAPQLIDENLSFFYAAAFGAGASDKAQDEARRQLATLFKALQEAEKAAQSEKARLAKRAGFAFPYDNSPEAFQTVLCTDSINPKNVEDWRKFADRAASTGDGFGRLWTWGSAPCASQSWTVKDRDAYRGPFTARTAHPVLVVGNYWDPATNYDGAVRAASLLPNSRLLSSDNFGHTAYGTSRCVTSSVNKYLLTTKVPKPGKACKSDFGAFESPLAEDEEASTSNSKRKSADAKTGADAKQEEILRGLPPVLPPVPGAVPRS